MSDFDFVGPRGKHVRVHISPSQDLTQSDDPGSWITEGDDPHFDLVPVSKRALQKSKWIRLEFDLELAGGPGETTLYWNDGSGYSRQRAFRFTPEASGPASFLLRVQPGLMSVRFVPVDARGEFVLPDIRLYSVSRRDIILHIAGRYLVRVIRHPRFYFDMMLDIFGLWRLQGSAGVKEVLRQYLVAEDKALIRGQLRSYRRKSGVQKSRAALAQPLYRKLPWSRRDDRRYRIAIGLVEHIGDIIASEPVVRYLRTKNSNAEISWVVSERYRELIDANPDIDQTIAVDCLTDWIKLVAHNTFDEYVDLHVNGRVCQCCMWPLRKRKGDISINGDNYFNYGSLLTAFSLGAGLPPLDEAPRMHISAEIVASVDTMGLPQKFMVLHCQTNEEVKNWTAQNWTSLAKWLRVSYDVEIVEIGLEPIISLTCDDVFDFCSKSTLLETAEIIRRAVLFIGLDSGPAHFANAVGTQGVVLLGTFRNFVGYNPFTGGYADGSKASLLRNPNGPTSALPISVVQEAVTRRMSISPSLVAVDGGPTDVVCPAWDGVYPSAKGAADDALESRARLLAFYLPQFHPIPENDANWGKGFTEWRNVGPSRAYFTGQQQPRVPTELGYYDLRLPGVMDQQADLAREHGIHGFCYYYYWFEGRRLLHLPIDNMLKRRSPDFPFCFCWANENWTRRWDGAERQILVAQNHTPQDDRRFIHALMPAFDDPRYIRVNGKPVLLVYRTELFPSPAATAELWRNEVRKAGIGDLYLVRCEGFDPFTTPAEIGFDASYEVPSFYLPTSVRADTSQLNVSPEFEGQIFDYDKIVRLFNERPDVSYERHRGVMLAWDNTPRYGKRAVVFHNVTEAAYERWLTNAIEYTNRRFSGEDRLVFVNAWNEWAEGSYLEPDLHRGRSLLEATQRVINRVAAPYSMSDIEV